MNETSIHDDGVISDMVRLHKEVRETLKDLTQYQEKWAEPTANIANNIPEPNRSIRNPKRIVRRNCYNIIICVPFAPIICCV